MKRYIVRWVDANGEVKEKLLKQEAFNRWNSSWNRNYLQVVEVEFDSMFNEKEE